MKRLAILLLGFLFLSAQLAQVAQADLILNQLNGFNVTGVTPKPSITFLQCSAENSSNLTTYTFSAQNTGTATGDRYTLIGITAEDGASVFTVSTVTVDGNSASSVVDIGAAANNHTQAIFIHANPTGTSEDVVVTFSEAIESARICLWQVNNIASATATATDTTSVGSGGAIDISINVDAFGVAVGVCASGNNAVSWTWTGMTERQDDVGSEHSQSAADYTNDATADTPRTISADPTGSNTNSCVSASFS